MRTIDLHTADGVMVRAPGHGILLSYGTIVPTSGASGYATGCNFIHTDGGAGTAFYINEGSGTSCSFVAVAAMTAAQEALLGAVAGTATASVAAILDANKALDVVRTASLMVGASGSELAVILADMVAGTGVSTGTSTVCEHRVTKVGGLFKTEIFLDITGLNDGGNGVTGAVVGKDAATVNCHVGQILAAVNGTIVAGRMSCLLTPATGHADIDLFTANEGTLAQDTAIGDATANVKIVDGATWATGDVIALTALPPADDHLVLAMGSGGGDADYSAGLFLIELWGV